MILKHLIRKEMKQFFRNPFMPKAVIMMPVMLILVFPWAATQEVSNVRLAFVDHDHSAESRRLIEKTTASGYFIAGAYCSSYYEAEALVRHGDADIIMEIAPNFGRNLKRRETSDIKVSANAVNGTKGTLGASHLIHIINDFSSDIIIENGLHGARADLSLSERYLFNPMLDYKQFMIPAFMVMLLTMLSGYLPALNIVNEKEKGTIEQMNVSPVTRLEFILGKLIPYWLIGIFVISLAMLLAWLTYGFVTQGSLLSIYVFVVVYISFISGFGLLISNYSDTMQQAMFVMFFFMLVFMLMSGLFTPVSSMPAWAQTIDILNPMKYFIESMRMIFLKGSGISQLLPNLLTLLLFAIIFNSWAVWSYRKSN